MSWPWVWNCWMAAVSMPGTLPSPPLGREVDGRVRCTSPRALDRTVLDQRRRVVPERRPACGQPRDPEVERPVAVVPPLDERPRRGRPTAPSPGCRRTAGDRPRSRSVRRSAVRPRWGCRASRRGDRPGDGRRPDPSTRGCGGSTGCTTTSSSRNRITSSACSASSTTRASTSRPFSTMRRIFRSAVLCPTTTVGGAPQSVRARSATVSAQTSARSSQVSTYARTPGDATRPSRGSGPAGLLALVK